MHADMNASNLAKSLSSLRGLRLALTRSASPASGHRAGFLSDSAQYWTRSGWKSRSVLANHSGVISRTNGRTRSE